MRRIPTQHLSTPVLTALGGTNSVEPTSHPNRTPIDWLPDLPLHWLPVAKGPAAVGEALKIRRIIQEMMFAVLNALPELSRVQQLPRNFGGVEFPLENVKTNHHSSLDRSI